MNLDRFQQRFKRRLWINLTYRRWNNISRLIPYTTLCSRQSSQFGKFSFHCLFFRAIKFNFDTKYQSDLFYKFPCSKDTLVLKWNYGKSWPGTRKHDHRFENLIEVLYGKPMVEISRLFHDIVLRYEKLTWKI